MLVRMIAMRTTRTAPTIARRARRAPRAAADALACEISGAEVAAEVQFEPRNEISKVSDVATEHGDAPMSAMAHDITLVGLVLDRLGDEPSAE